VSANAPHEGGCAPAKSRLSQSTAEGWCLASWNGKGGGGVAVHLQGHLEEEALRTLPSIGSMSAQFNRTNIGGSYIPLHRSVWERDADKDVFEVLFEVLASREHVRLRLSDRECRRQLMLSCGRSSPQSIVLGMRRREHAVRRSQ